MRLSLVIAAVCLTVCSGQNLRRSAETGLLESNDGRALTLGELIESQALQKENKTPKSKRSKEGKDERMGSDASDNKKKEKRGKIEASPGEKRREGVKDKPEKKEKDLEKELGKRDKEEKKNEGKDRGEANNEKKQKKAADEKKKPDQNGVQNQDQVQDDQDGQDAGVTSDTGDGIQSRGRLGFLGLLRPCNFLAKQFDVPIKCEIDLLRSLLRDRQIKFKVSLEKALCADNRLASICVTPSFKGALDFDDRLLSTKVEFGDMRIGDAQLGDLSLSLGTCFSRNSRSLSSQSMLAISNREFVHYPDNAASTQGEQPTGSALHIEEALPPPSSTSDLVDTENTTDTASPDGVPSPNSTKDELGDGNTAAAEPSLSVISNDTDVDVPSTPDDEPPVDDTSDGNDGNGGGDVDDDSGSSGGGLCTCNAAYKGRSCQLCEFCRGGGVRFDCSNIVPMISSGGQCQSIDAITSLLGNGQRILPTIPDFLFNLISN